MQIKIKLMTGGIVCVDVPENATLDDVRTRIWEQEMVAANVQRFIYNGKTLTGNKTLKEYRIVSDSVLHMLLALRGG